MMSSRLLTRSKSRPSWCGSALYTLESTNSVTLSCVSGQARVHGNGCPDELAKKGAKVALFGSRANLWHLKIFCYSAIKK